jgi:hypothetical protein
MAAVAVCLAELDFAAHEFPLAFLTLPGGQLRLVGLLGSRGTNLFVAPDGRWRGGYAPALIRAHPFAWQRSPGGEALLCIDEASPLLSEDKGTPLFDPDGTLAETTAKAAGFISHLAQQFEATEVTSRRLLECGLLEPWNQADMATLLGSGFLKVSESRLRDLKASQLQELLLAGALTLAFAQILSMPLLARLNLAGGLLQEESSKERLADLAFRF